MYGILKGIALRVMRAPTEPPEPPSGSHGSVQVFRASPKYLTYRLLGFWVLFSVLWVVWWVLLGEGLTQSDEGPLVAAVIALPFLVIFQFVFYFVVRIDYDMRYYIVTDRSLRVREGAVIVKEMTITYANVQNIRVVQGPLLRLLGIWHLNIDTAGGGGASQKGEHGGGHSIRMAGIENAREVRDQVLAHLRRIGGGAGLGDLDDREGNAALRASPELASVLGELRDSAAALRRAAEAGV